MRCECEDVFSHPRLPPLQLVLRGRAVLDPGPSGGRVRGVAIPTKTGFRTPRARSLIPGIICDVGGGGTNWLVTSSGSTVVAAFRGRGARLRRLPGRHTDYETKLFKSSPPNSQNSSKTAIRGHHRARSAARAFRRDLSIHFVIGCAPPSTRRAIRSVSVSVRASAIRGTGVLSFPVFMRLSLIHI